MTNHQSGCLVCGQPLEYFETPKTLACSICGAKFESAAACRDGHFVCDQCHSQAGLEAVTRLALDEKSADPVDIARRMMENKFIHMHGPEHHYLVPAALLTAYKNAGGRLDLERTLALARQRAAKVPGGICGLWGSCGAAIGSGIFVSLATGATPMSGEPWSLANEMTSRSLAAIAAHGGPRCCKRDTWLATLAAVDFSRERLGVTMTRPDSIECSFFPANPSCKEAACLFFPG